MHVIILADSAVFCGEYCLTKLVTNFHTKTLIFLFASFISIFPAFFTNALLYVSQKNDVLDKRKYRKRSIKRRQKKREPYFQNKIYVEYLFVKMSCKTYYFNLLLFIGPHKTIFSSGFNKTLKYNIRPKHLTRDMCYPPYNFFMCDMYHHV